MSLTTNRLDAPASPSSPVAAVLLALAPVIPALILAFPLIVWPLLEGKSANPMSDFLPPAPETESGSLNRIFFLPIFALSLVMAYLRGRETPLGLNHPALVAMALLLGWFALTTLWALDNGIATRRLILQVIIITSIVASVLACREPRQVMAGLFLVAVATTLLNAVALITMPAGPIGHEGIYPQKNYLGAVMAVVVLLAIYQLHSGPALARLAAIATLLLALVILWESRSKTSLILAVSVPFISYGVIVIARLLRITPAITVPAGLIMLWGIFALGESAYVWSFSSLAQLFFGDPTLTSRTEIWAFAVKMIEQRPWLGYGYDSFWGIGFEAPSYREAPGFVAKMPHAHNGYLDLLLQGGAVALALLPPILLSGLAAAGRVARNSSALAAFAVAAIVLAMLHNCLETSWFRGFGANSMLLILAISVLVRQRQRQRELKS